MLVQVIYPRTAGFQCILDGLHKNPAVKYLYDLTILYPYENPCMFLCWEMRFVHVVARVPAIWKMLKGGNKFNVVVYVKRHEVWDFPKNDTNTCCRLNHCQLTQRGSTTFSLSHIKRRMSCIGHLWPTGSNCLLR